MRVIADTLGLDLAELKDYRYQPSRNSRAIYCIANEYFAVGKVAPAGDLKWHPYRDQFFANAASTVLWHAEG